MTVRGAERLGVGLTGGWVVRSLTQVLRRLTKTMHILMCHFQDGKIQVFTFQIIRDLSISHASEGIIRVRF